MRRFTLTLHILLLIMASGSIAANNTRFTAMGGAFTAIGDDANTIKANPAGLAYLNSGTLVLSATGSVHPAFSAFTYEAPLIDDLGGKSPLFDLYYDRSDSSVYSSDDDSSTTYNQALIGLGFDTTGSSSIEYDEFSNMQSWYEATTIFDFLASQIHTMGLTADVSYVDKNFGASYTRGLSVEGSPPDPGNTLDVISSYEYAIAVGQRIGNLAFGVNTAYRASSTVRMPNLTFDTYNKSCTDLVDLFGTDDPDEIGIKIATGSFFDDRGKETNHFSIGTGSMLAVGPVTIGASLDDITPIFLRDNHYNKLSQRIFHNLNIGIAYESNERKQDSTYNFANLILAADVKNIGDPDKRTLHLGGEFGLSLGEILTADARAGYTQDLHQSFNQMLDGDIWDEESSVWSFGVGAKMLIFQLDMALTIPSRTLQQAIAVSMDDNASIEYLFDSLESYDGPRLMVTGSVVF